MVYFVCLMVTELVKVNVLLAFRHTAQGFPRPLHEPVTISREYNLALTDCMFLSCHVKCEI